MPSQGFEKVSVEVVKFVSSSVDFFHISQAEHPAGPSLLDTLGVRKLEKYAREEDLQDPNDSNNLRNDERSALHRRLGDRS